MIFSRLFRAVFGSLLLCILAMVVPGSSSAGERLFSEAFERPDSLIVGNGWVEIFSGGECVGVERESSQGKNSNLLFAEDEKKEINDLQSEINKELTAEEKVSAKSKVLPEATAELQDGQLFLHFQENQASQMVQKDIDKLVTRVSYDFSPLYAMGGMDDRAWIGMRVYLLDHKDRILGELRNFYYNVIFDEFENSDTIYSNTSQGPFDGATRHASIDVSAILKKQLLGVDPARVAKTRISLEISSNICGSTVEGYADNIVAVLADATGLFRFNQEEMLDITNKGAELFTKDPEGFPSNWIDAVTATYGHGKLSAWLNEIPADVRANPAKLAILMGELFKLDGKNAFVVAYGVTIMLHHF